MAVPVANSNQKISVEDAKEALKRSGYLLESRVETILRQAEYFVETNILYEDPSTGKKRELDLIASTGANLFKNTNDANYQPSSFLKEHFSNWSHEELRHIDRILGDIDITLIIECINNTQPLTFIKNSIRCDDDYAREHCTEIRASKVAGQPQIIQRDYPPEYDMNLSSLVALALRCIEIKDFYTQYCSFKMKKDQTKPEWMAYHDDIQHDSFNTLCSVLDQKLAETNKFYSSPNNHSGLTIDLHIPLLVIQNDLWVMSEKQNGEVQVEEAEHVNYFRAPSSLIRSSGGYHIDVIKEGYLERYLSDVISNIIKVVQTFCFDHIAKKDERLIFKLNQSKEGTE